MSFLSHNYRLESVVDESIEMYDFHSSVPGTVNESLTGEPPYPSAFRCQVAHFCGHLISELRRKTALFFYDYLLNLSREVELIWHGPFQFTTFLYFICRYVPCVGLIFDLATINGSASFLGSRACIFWS